MSLGQPPGGSQGTGEGGHHHPAYISRVLKWGAILAQSGHS
jgi:hypothetical protein